jgi:hypothetical protein
MKPIVHSMGGVVSTAMAVVGRVRRLIGGWTRRPEIGKLACAGLCLATAPVSVAFHTWSRWRARAAYGRHSPKAARAGIGDVKAEH